MRSGTGTRRCGGRRRPLLVQAPLATRPARSRRRMVMRRRGLVAGCEMERRAAHRWFPPRRTVTVCRAPAYEDASLSPEGYLRAEAADQCC